MRCFFSGNHVAKRALPAGFAWPEVLTFLLGAFGAGGRHRLRRPSWRRLSTGPAAASNASWDAAARWWKVLVEVDRAARQMRVLFFLRYSPEALHASVRDGRGQDPSESSSLLTEASGGL